MSPAWRQQCSAMERVCANEYEWELFRTTEYCDLQYRLFFGRKSFYVSSCIIQRVLVLYVNCKNTVNLPSCQKNKRPNRRCKSVCPNIWARFRICLLLAYHFSAQISDALKNLENEVANRKFYHPLICSWMQIEWQFARKLGLSKFKIAFRAKLRTSASRIKFYEKANLASKTPQK